MKKITLFILAFLIFTGSMQPVMAMEAAFSAPASAAPVNPIVNINIAVYPHLTRTLYANQATLSAHVQQQQELQAILNLRQTALLRHHENDLKSIAAYQSTKKEAQQRGFRDGIKGGLLSGMGYATALAMYSDTINQQGSKLPLDAMGIGAFIGLHCASNYWFNLQRKINRKPGKYPDCTPEGRAKVKNKYHEQEKLGNILATAAVATGAYATLVQTDENPVVSFCKTLPAVLVGVTALKWLTYTGMRSYKKWSRGDYARQAPQAEAQLP
jgi:hypothetical protein